MASFQDTFGVGEQLQSKDTTISSYDALKDKVVGLYFSAHWCPPCRGFTPKLVDFYNKLKATGRNFEIVFVSSDKNQKEFDEYYSEMPWLALPYSDRDRKNALSKKFKVSGIPSFIIMDTDGSTICKDGRSEVMEDSEGKNFPWKPKSLSELIGDSFVNSKGESLGLDAIEGKTIGLYFSAHWCPPCKGFTPVLAKTYEKVKASGKEFEIVFISSDRDEDGFKEYLGEMPWIALPYSKRTEKSALSKHFEVNGIPSLVILDSEYGVINGEARNSIDADPEGKKFPWFPPPVSVFPAGVDKLNDNTCCVALLENLDDGDQQEALDVLESFVKELKGSSSENEEMIFLASTGGDSIAPQIRKLTDQTTPKDGPELLILDIPDDGAYYLPSVAVESITAETLKSLMSDFKSKKLEKKQLKK